MNNYNIMDEYRNHTDSFLKFFNPDMKIHGVNLDNESEVKKYLEAISGVMNDMIFNPIDYELLIFLEYYYSNIKYSEDVINCIFSMKEKIYKNYYDKLVYYNRVCPNHYLNNDSDKYLKSIPNALPKSNSKVYAFYYTEMEGLKGRYQQTFDHTGKNAKLLRNNKIYTTDISDDARKSKVNENNTENKK